MWFPTCRPPPNPHRGRGLGRGLCRRERAKRPETDCLPPAGVASAIALPLAVAMVVAGFAGTMPGTKLPER